MQGALPGEVVEGEAIDGYMSTPRIILPSPDRVRPPCRHARLCGGCRLQHASDAFVENWKTDTVRRALHAHGLPAPIRKIATSPKNSRRRASLSGHRTRSGSVVGFHARASGTVIDVPDCRILDPRLMSGMPLLCDLTRLSASRKGVVKFALLATDAGLDVSLSDAKTLDTGTLSAVVDLTRHHDVARLTWNGERIVQHRPPTITLGAARVVPPPGAFLQATPQGELDLQQAVCEAVGDAPHVVDLFSGLGTFGLPMAARAKVHAVENDDALLAALDLGWRQAEGLKPVTTERRDLFRRPLDTEDLRPFDAAVLDPPRAGAKAQASCLAQDGPERIAMVSCNPTTFGRDCRLLVDGGYRLEWIDVIDQFRWSAHVEVAAALTR